jgi:hypothetical protein
LYWHVGKMLWLHDEQIYENIPPMCGWADPWKAGYYVRSPITIWVNTSVTRACSTSTDIRVLTITRLYFSPSS